MLVVGWWLDQMISWRSFPTIMILWSLTFYLITLPTCVLCKCLLYLMLHFQIIFRESSVTLQLWYLSHHCAFFFFFFAWSLAFVYHEEPWKSEHLWCMRANLAWGALLHNFTITLNNLEPICYGTGLEKWIQITASGLILSISWMSFW